MDETDESTAAKETFKPDTIDLRILEILSREANRISREEIASRLGVKSATTISNRIHKLEEAGIIRGYRAEIAFDKLGLEEWKIVCEVVVSKGELRRTEEEIAKLPETIAVYDSTGQTDIIVIAKFKQRQDLSNFTKKLLAMEYVERTITHVVLNTVKEDFLSFSLKD